MRCLSPLVAGFLVAATASSTWADSFREIGVAPPRTDRSAAAPGGDPDANLPTESVRPHPAVVRVIVPESGSTSYGSGTLVDVNGEHGLVLTNYHVVAEAVSPPTVLFADGFRSFARIVKSDHDWDLAALIIWRPNVEPVPVASVPPQPGELLAIAGYGQGPYRLASGRCTNYLSPNTRLPREMVELAAAARQGDSGGPIFNQRGELAGVLWGEGSGYTTGSYCGRVRQFLSTVLPPAELQSGDDQLIAVAPRAVARKNADTALVSATSHIEETAATNAVQTGNGTVLSRCPALPTRPGTVDEASSRNIEPSANTWPFDWQALAGRTRAEQGKSLLAVIGAIAIALRVRRSVSRPAAA